jgi:four helix bundle protein
MATAFEDLRILQSAEGCADKIWKQVVQWDEFAKDVVWKQMARAMDSIGANIAESYGRFNFGEKLQFLYYARGSLFETKYWLNRAKTRDLMPSSDVQEYVSRLTDIAKQLNSFAESLKSQHSGGKTVRELAAEYEVDLPEDFPETLFGERDLEWFRS